MTTNNDAIDAFFSGIRLPREKQNQKVFTVKMIPTKKEKKHNPRENAGTSYVDQYQKVLEADLAKTFTTLNLTGITANNASEPPTFANTTRDEDDYDDDTLSQFITRCESKELPIAKFKKEIVQQIRSHPVTIIRGLTGCGKTTQVCQYIFDDCNARNEICNILVSQPRKIAAITVAQRVCQERNVALGTSVGYQVGLNKKINMAEDESTQITFCTTGVILQKLINDKSMAKYSHIILDEVHERDIEIDFLIILVRRFLALNSPMTKIILMSATLDSEKFQEFFKIPLNESIENEYVFPPIIDLNSAKRTYEITEKYLDDLSPNVLMDHANLIDYQEPGISNEMYAVAAKLIAIHLQTTKNKIDQRRSRNFLVFLPGLYEIERLQEELESGASKDQLKQFDVEVHVLHSSLSMEEQKGAFGQSNKTKIILSTNIAESSVTLPNIVHVIDFCLTKNLTSRNGTQMSSLVLSWATKNNCKQRAGRTGRVMSGIVYRLVHKEFYRKMPEQAIPEIRLIPLESVVIRIKKLEMGTPLEILAVSLDPPDQSKVIDAILSLKETGGLFRFDKDEKFEYTDGELTFLGDIMSALPCDTRITRLIVLGYMFSVLDEVVIIGAGLTINRIFLHSLADKIGAYAKKVKWSNGSGSDCIAIYHAYTTWIYNHENRVFRTIDEERNWCRIRGLDLKNLNEMRLLIMEFKKRLVNFKIIALQDHNQPRWLPNEKMFVIKMVLAGAFGVANFFLPDHRENMERETFKVANDFDLKRTVYFRGFDKTSIGEIYRERMKEMLIEKGVCKKETNIEIFFNPQSSGQIYVTFDSDEHAADGEFNFNLNNVVPEVYKAVKLRQINNEFKVPVLTPIQSIYYAQDKGLGELSENGFVYNYCYIAKPEYFTLPTKTTDKMKGVIEHVEDCGKFYFRPEVAYCSILNQSDDRYVTDNEELKSMLKTAALMQPTYPVTQFKYGRYCIYSNSKERDQFHQQERAKFIRMCSDGKVKINLLDRGVNIEVTQDTIFEIKIPRVSSDIFSYPRRVFECRLKEVQPSVQKSSEGKWAAEAIEKFRKLTAINKSTIEIFSVIDGVVTVDLTTGDETTMIHWNKELVKEGFAEACEESYLTKSNNLMRKSLYYGSNVMADPKEEFAKIVDKDQLQRYIESPAKNKCREKMTLTGPFSPLEKNLRGISSILNNQVSIDTSSINQIFLDDNFYKNHGKFFVAGDLSFNLRSQNIRLRDTTRMPSIIGLPVILALIFAPYAEIRRDDEKHRYVSILTGLGYDEKNDRPYFEERDASLIVDFSLTSEDIYQINHLRLLMSNLLYTTPLESIPNINDSIKANYLNKIKNIFTSLINKKHSLCDVQYPKDLFTWSVDQEDAKQLTNTLGYRSIFQHHAMPMLTPLSREAREKLRKHVRNLEKGSLTGVNRECKICEKSLESELDVKFHLMSLMHAERKAALGL